MPLQFYAFHQFVSQAKGLLSAAIEGLTNIFKSFFLSGKLKKQYNDSH
jgi:hypothetical protein